MSDSESDEVHSDEENDLRERIQTISNSIRYWISPDQRKGQIISEFIQHGKRIAEAMIKVISIRDTLKDLIESLTGNRPNIELSLTANQKTIINNLLSSPNIDKYNKNKLRLLRRGMLQHSKEMLELRDIRLTVMAATRILNEPVNQFLMEISRVFRLRYPLLARAIQPYNVFPNYI